MVSGMYNAFHADYKIEPANAKYFHIDSSMMNNIKKVEGIENASLVIEEISLLRYNDQQKVAKLKGIQPLQGYENRFDSLIVDGYFDLQQDSTFFAVPGIGVFYELGINLNNPSTQLVFYAPNRTSSTSSDISSSFLIERAIPTGYFSVQQEFDESYVMVPYDLCTKLFSYDNCATSIELFTSNGANTQKIKKDLQNIVGENFIVKNRFEQEEALFKIMKTEKLIVFVILVFIVLITSFNLISTLTLVILDKRKDLISLRAMGAKISQIRSIFAIQGSIIGFFGLILGLACGTIVVLIQQYFGIINLQSGGSGIFIPYPVKLLFSDYMLIFLTVLLISFLVSLIPARKITNDWLRTK